MKRCCPFKTPGAKRMHLHSLKRQGDDLSHEPKRLCLDTSLKRKQEFEHMPDKRRRLTDSVQNLERKLHEAYARIAQLEAELKQSKMVQQYLTGRINLPYNHDITCY